MAELNKDHGLSVKLKVGYGIASLGDTIVYNILMVYALYYLTEVAKMNSVMAGMVLFIASAWNAFFIGVVGYVSDRSSYRLGRRYPYMTYSILPVMALTVLMFTNIGGTPMFQAVYYTIVNTCLWTAHSTYVVPYEALGAELTSDTDERTALRSYARFFMGIGNIFGMVLVLNIVDLFMAGGNDESGAWQKTAISVALVAGLSQAATCYLLKNNMVSSAAKNNNHKKSGILREYLEVIGIKPFRYLLATTVFFAAANVFVTSDIVYFMKYNLSLPDNMKSIIFLILTVAGMILTPMIAAFARVFDKKHAMVAAFLLTGAGFAIFGVLGISSFFSFAVYIVLFSIGSSAYWQLIFSVVYDISEVDEYLNKKRREAIILSSSKIFLRISTAVTVQMLGIYLYCFDYRAEAEMQTNLTLSGLSAALTFIPAILFFLSALSIYLYPISRKKHRKLLDDLENELGEQRADPII